MMDGIEVKDFLLRHIDGKEVTRSIREIKYDPRLLYVSDKFGHLGPVLTDPNVVFLCL